MRHHPRSLLAVPAVAVLVALVVPPPSAAAQVSAPAARPPAPPTRVPGAPAMVKPASWTRGANIYEVNVRQFTPEGTLSALRGHLPRLDSLGVDILWLMPVQPIGRKNRKGPLGSYYAIANYTAINPEFGSAADFRAFVDDAHRRGQRVILDWVANHTAYDHPWITEHPDWYARRPDGTFINARDNENNDTDWTDVAELDFGNRDMRRAMIADMRWWLDTMKIDGFRCDVAGGVPMDFWVTARRELARGHPQLFMLAEAESTYTHQAFDMTYGWELHHLLNDLAKGKKPTSTLDAYFAKQVRTYPRDAYRMYFTSNHDENSWQGTEFERMGENHAPAFVLAATAVQGMPLIYTGQEAGMNKRLRFFEKDTVDWNGPSLAGFYARTLDLKHRNAALWNGASGGPQVRLATDGGDRVYAYTRTKGANTVLVAVNFGDAPAKVAYRGLSRPGAYTDWYGRSKLTLGATGQLEIPAHGYRVLVR